MNEEIRTARAAAYQALADRPRERRSGEDGVPSRVRSSVALVKPDTQERAAVTERNGLSVVHIRGWGSVTESGYEMYDAFGPYTEIVTRGAFGKTLASNPSVGFNVNHGKTGSGMAMAHTKNDTLDLAEDQTGLQFDAYVDPTRNDVSDLVKAMDRGDQTEASFRFRIVQGMWSPDYSEFRINEADLDNGDVSSVDVGANPAASAGLARKAQPVDLRAVKLRFATDDDRLRPAV